MSCFVFTPNNIEMSWCSCALSCTLRNQIEIKPILMSHCIVNDGSRWWIGTLIIFSGEEFRTTSFLDDDHRPFRPSFRAEQRI